MLVAWVRVGGSLAGSVEIIPRALVQTERSTIDDR